MTNVFYFVACILDTHAYCVFIAAAMAQEQLARMLPDETDDLVSNNFNPNLQFEIEKPGFAPYRVRILFEWVLCRSAKHI